MNLYSNIRNVLQENSVNFRENGQSFILDCCKCGKKEKLYIRKRDGRFICFTCSDDFKGKVDKVLSELLGITTQQANEMLDIDNFSAPVHEPLELSLPTEHKKMSPSIVGWYHPLFVRGQLYLEGRGITLEMMKFYNIHYDYVSKRVIFPVLDGEGIVGWTDRSVLPDEKLDYVDKFGNSKHIPKSLHNFDKSKYLLFNELWPENADYLILAEGPVSAMKAHLCGNTVASMGKHVSDHQLDIIRARKLKSLYLGLDPDAGDKIEKLVEKLYGRGTDIYLLRPAKGKKDLGACSVEEVYDVFKSSTEKLTPSHIIVI